jgi:protein arginine kinase activator
MLCDKCKKNTATIHYQQIINGKLTSMNLCSKCAALDGYSNPFEINPMELNDFIASVFNLNPERVRHTVKCSECGYTLDKFNKTSLLGCDKCYDSFRKELLPIIKNIHGSTLHVGGKAPVQSAVDNVAVEIDKLKTELNQAVKNEEYELAATLRDRIKELEAKGEKKNG